MSFHPRLLTRVIDAHGRRQRRLSEVGLSRAPPASGDPKEETSAAGEARTPTRRLQWPESEYKDGSPLVDLTEGPLVDLTNTPRRSPSRFLHVPLPPLRCCFISQVRLCFVQRHHAPSVDLRLGGRPVGAARWPSRPPLKCPLAAGLPVWADFADYEKPKN